MSTPEETYRRGSLVLRGDQIPRLTADASLLQTEQSADWKHTDPWRVLRIQSEFVEGFEALAKVGPAISVFGSARTSPDDPLYECARRIGELLVERGYAVITGGGPGMMEAANRGAWEAGGTSVGLGIELPHEQSMNRWVNRGVNFRYFFARKTMFVKYSQGFTSSCRAVLARWTSSLSRRPWFRPARFVPSRWCSWALPTGRAWSTGSAPRWPMRA